MVEYKNKTHRLLNETKNVLRGFEPRVYSKKQTQTNNSNCAKMKLISNYMFPLW